MMADVPPSTPNSPDPDFLPSDEPLGLKQPLLTAPFLGINRKFLVPLGARSLSILDASIFQSDFIQADFLDTDFEDSPFFSPSLTIARQDQSDVQVSPTSNNTPTQGSSSPAAQPSSQANRVVQRFPQRPTSNPPSVSNSAPVETSPLPEIVGDRGERGTASLPDAVDTPSISPAESLEPSPESGLLQRQLNSELSSSDAQDSPTSQPGGTTRDVQRSPASNAISLASTPVATGNLQDTGALQPSESVSEGIEPSLSAPLIQRQLATPDVVSLSRDSEGGSPTTPGTVQASSEQGATPTILESSPQGAIAQPPTISPDSSSSSVSTASSQASQSQPGDTPVRISSWAGDDIQRQVEFTTGGDGASEEPRGELGEGDRQPMGLALPEQQSSAVWPESVLQNQAMTPASTQISRSVVVDVSSAKPGESTITSQTTPANQTPVTASELAATSTNSSSNSDIASPGVASDSAPVQSIQSAATLPPASPPPSPTIQRQFQPESEPSGVRQNSESAVASISDSQPTPLESDRQFQASPATSPQDQTVSEIQRRVDLTNSASTPPLTAPGVDEADSQLHAPLTIQPSTQSDAATSNPEADSPCQPELTIQPSPPAGMGLPDHAPPSPVPPTPLSFGGASQSEETVDIQLQLKPSVNLTQLQSGLPGISMGNPEPPATSETQGAEIQINAENSQLPTLNSNSGAPPEIQAYTTPGNETSLEQPSIQAISDGSTLQASSSLPSHSTPNSDSESLQLNANSLFSSLTASTDFANQPAQSTQSTQPSATAKPEVANLIQPQHDSVSGSSKGISVQSNQSTQPNQPTQLSSATAKPEVANLIQPQRDPVSGSSKGVSVSGLASPEVQRDSDIQDSGLTRLRPDVPGNFEIQNTASNQPEISTSTSSELPIEVQRQPLADGASTTQPSGNLESRLEGVAELRQVPQQPQLHQPEADILLKPSADSHSSSEVAGGSVFEPDSEATGATVQSSELAQMALNSTPHQPSTDVIQTRLESSSESGSAPQVSPHPQQRILDADVVQAKLKVADTAFSQRMSEKGDLQRSNQGLSTDSSTKESEVQPLAQTSQPSSQSQPDQTTIPIQAKSDVHAEINSLSQDASLSLEPANKTIAESTVVQLQADIANIGNPTDSQSLLISQTDVDLRSSIDAVQRNLESPEPAEQISSLTQSTFETPQNQPGTSLQPKSDSATTPVHDTQDSLPDSDAPINWSAVDTADATTVQLQAEESGTTVAHTAVESDLSIDSSSSTKPELVGSQPQIDPVVQSVTETLLDQANISVQPQLDHASPAATSNSQIYSTQLESTNPAVIQPQSDASGTTVIQREVSEGDRNPSEPSVSSPNVIQREVIEGDRNISEPSVDAPNSAVAELGATVIQREVSESDRITSESFVAVPNSAAADLGSTVIQREFIEGDRNPSEPSVSSPNVIQREVIEGDRPTPELSIDAPNSVASESGTSVIHREVSDGHGLAAEPSADAQNSNSAAAGELDLQNSSSVQSGVNVHLDPASTSVQTKLDAQPLGEAQLQRQYNPSGSPELAINTPTLASEAGDNATSFTSTTSSDTPISSVSESLENQQGQRQLDTQNPIASVSESSGNQQVQRELNEQSPAELTALAATDTTTTPPTLQTALDGLSATSNGVESASEPQTIVPAKSSSVPSSAAPATAAAIAQPSNDQSAPASDALSDPETIESRQVTSVEVAIQRAVLRTPLDSPSPASAGSSPPGDSVHQSWDDSAKDAPDQSHTSSPIPERRISAPGQAASTHPQVPSALVGESNAGSQFADAALQSQIQRQSLPEVVPHPLASSGSASPDSLPSVGQTTSAHSLTNTTFPSHIQRQALSETDVHPTTQPDSVSPDPASPASASGTISQAVSTSAELQPQIQAQPAPESRTQSSEATPPVSPTSTTGVSPTSEDESGWPAPAPLDSSTLAIQRSLDDLSVDAATAAADLPQLPQVWQDLTVLRPLSGPTPEVQRQRITPTQAAPELPPTVADLPDLSSIAPPTPEAASNAPSPGPAARSALPSEWSSLADLVEQTTQPMSSRSPTPIQAKPDTATPVVSEPPQPLSDISKGLLTVAQPKRDASPSKPASSSSSTATGYTPPRIQARSTNSPASPSSPIRITRTPSAAPIIARAGDDDMGTYSSTVTSSHSGEDQTDYLEAIAQAIYLRLRQRLRVEQERLGRDYSGRLPW